MLPVREVLGTRVKYLNTYLPTNIIQTPERQNATPTSHPHKHIAHGRFDSRNIFLSVGKLTVHFNGNQHSHIRYRSMTKPKVCKSIPSLRICQTQSKQSTLHRLHTSYRVFLCCIKEMPKDHQDLPTKPYSKFTFQQDTEVCTIEVCFMNMK